MADGFGDALSAPFWDGTALGELRLQRCAAGHFQFLPRPFCVTCGAEVAWVKVSGRGTIYSVTEVCEQLGGVQLGMSAVLDVPYFVALIDLQEGPRLLGNVLGGQCAIGDAVLVSWFDRGDDLPPLPMFMVVAS